MASTIIDVAKLCGYSKATVSRAFASPELVSEKAREEIYAAAKQLDYSPNAIARAMATKRTENVTFIINEMQYPAILNPFYSLVLEGVILEVTRRGYSIFVTTISNMRLPNGGPFFKKHMDGVVFAGEVNKDVIQEFLSKDIPVVVVNNHLDMEGLFCVTVDHLQGAIDATEHLYQRGHRKIGLIAGRFSRQVSEARYNGYLSVLQSHGIPIDQRYIVDIEPTIRDAQAAVEEILQQDDPPTALFCTNDTIAAGALKAIRRQGLRVPEDVAVVGFDDSYISQVVEPELTTVRIDAANLGCLATQKLFDIMDGAAIEKESIELPTKLIVRSTT